MFTMGKEREKKIINRRKKQFQIIIIQKEFFFFFAFNIENKNRDRKKRGSFGGEKLFKEK